MGYTKNTDTLVKTGKEKARSYGSGPCESGRGGQI